MVAGQQNNIKVGFIIQARMQSERLPGKVMTPIPLTSGKPLLGWIHDELIKSKFENEIFIATSVIDANNAIEKYCIENKINCFRGDEENVLSRFIEIIKKNDFDVVVRLTGDNPLVDIELLDKTIENHYQQKNDYTCTLDLPLGMNFEIISPAALLSLESENLQPEDKEHVTLFLRKNSKFKKQEIKFGIDTKLSALRLSVDYPADWLVLNTILTIIQREQVFGIEAVKEIFNQYPWIFSVNIHHIQKNPK